ncbi:MAG TPA: hypothetical protein VM577_08715, partial [Anaerovoracaceae bacterium]|nr:hypothetical protein [Anaerovoracaceae bacterium]
SREYLTLLNQFDSDREPIKKDRVCFLWENQYFELDLFKNRDLIVLEAEIEEFQPAKLCLPPWIEIEREVTAEKEFSNASLARKK